METHGLYEVSERCTRFPAGHTVFERLRNEPELRDRLKLDYDERTGDGAETALKHAAWSVLRPLAPLAYSKDTRHQAGKDRYTPESWRSFTIKMKETASFFGAALIGITRVNRLWLYDMDGAEVVPEELNTAVVMALEMDKDLIKTSPSSLADAATGHGYARMAFATAGMATYIRELGWDAVGCGNDTALSIPLAIDAGLGECMRNGLLTTAEYGSRIRICKVFTDMPLVEDQPTPLGISKRCETCRRCVKACPVDAISSDKKTMEALNVSSNPGVLKWPVDGEKCRLFWSINGSSCSNCISACPFTYPG